MSISRYDNRSLITNTSKEFREHFDKRDVKFIRHFSTMSFNPEAFEKTKGIIIQYVVWGSGDRLHKLAEQYYGDGKLWFLIALFNERPTDAHIKLGETIAIPTPVSKVLEMFGI